MQSLTFFFPTDFSSTISFFFLALRPPSISTLFPYTTLFRSPVRRAPPPIHAGAARGDPADGPPSRHTARSEEHTSELQSRGHLVCRLLLEKKNNTAEAQLHSMQQIEDHIDGQLCALHDPHQL